MSALKQGIPWDRLVRMSLTRVISFLDSMAPAEEGADDGVRDATQADIDRLMGS